MHWQRTHCTQLHYMSPATHADALGCMRSIFSQNRHILPLIAQHRSTTIHTLPCRHTHLYIGVCMQVLIHTCSDSQVCNASATPHTPIQSHWSSKPPFLPFLSQNAGSFFLLFLLACFQSPKCPSRNRVTTIAHHIPNVVSLVPCTVPE